MDLEAFQLREKNTVVRSDSRRMVRQWNGEYRGKDEKAKDSVRPSEGFVAPIRVVSYSSCASR